jgi:hypothetical protein
VCIIVVIISGSVMRKQWSPSHTIGIYRYRYPTQCAYDCSGVLSPDEKGCCCRDVCLHGTVCCSSSFSIRCGDWAQTTIVSRSIVNKGAIFWRESETLDQKNPMPPL